MCSSVISNFKDEECRSPDSKNIQAFGGKFLTTEGIESTE